MKSTLYALLLVVLLQASSTQAFEQQRMLKGNKGSKSSSSSSSGSAESGSASSSKSSKKGRKGDSSSSTASSTSETSEDETSEEETDDMMMESASIGLTVVESMNSFDDTLTNLRNALDGIAAITTVGEVDHHAAGELPVSEKTWHPIRSFSLATPTWVLH